MPYIYKITNKLNGKVYIGKTEKTIQERWNEHCHDYAKNSESHRPLYKAMIKYGVENFYIEEVEKCSSDDLANREVYWIEHFGSFKYGYNATIGGDGKPYIDRKIVVDAYYKYKNIETVSKILSISRDSVSSILHSNNILPVTGAEIAKARAKHIIMCDKNNAPILVFNSSYDCITWLHEHNLCNAKNIKSVRAHITDVCKGKRKSAYGYIWKYM